MATVLEKSTMRILESVNTPDYPETDFIINPDLSAVAGVPEKYWTIKDNTVAAIPAEEQATVDAALAAEVESKTPACPYGLRDKCEYYKP